VAGFEDLPAGFASAAILASRAKAVGLETAIKADNDIRLVGPYHPSTFSFGGHVKGAKPSDMAGWDTPLDDVREFSGLPAQAQKYVRRLEQLVKTEIILVSVGPGREQTILLKNPFHR